MSSLRWASNILIQQRKRKGNYSVIFRRATVLPHVHQIHLAQYILHACLLDEEPQASLYLALQRVYFVGVMPLCSYAVSIPHLKAWAFPSLSLNISKLPDSYQYKGCCWKNWSGILCQDDFAKKVFLATSPLQKRNNSSLLSLLPQPKEVALHLLAWKAHFLPAKNLNVKNSKQKHYRLIPSPIYFHFFFHPDLGWTFPPSTLYLFLFCFKIGKVCLMLIHL